MSFRLPSYDDKYGDCNSGTKDEPCWGKVQHLDERFTDNYLDYWVGDLCEGHMDSSYEPSRHICDEVEPTETDI